MVFSGSPPTETRPPEPSANSASETTPLSVGDGLHTNFAYFVSYPALNDPYTTFLNLGVGLGFHGYVKVSETAALHMGITGSFDFLQIFFGNNEFYINSYKYGLGGGFTIFVGAGWVARRAEVDAVNGRQTETGNDE